MKVIVGLGNPGKAHAADRVEGAQCQQALGARGGDAGQVPGRNPHGDAGRPGCAALTGAPGLYARDDGGAGAGQGLLAELGREGVGHVLGVAQEGLDHLGLGDGLDDLAVHEDLALAVARGAAQAL